MTLELIKERNLVFRVNTRELDRELGIEPYILKAYGLCPTILAYPK